MFNHFFARAVLFSEQSKGLNLFRFVHEYTCNRFWQPALKHYLLAPRQKKTMYVSFLDGFIVFVLPCQFSMRSSIVLQTLTWLQHTVRWIKFKWNYTYENINSIWKRCEEREGEKETSRNIHIWLWMCARCEATTMGEMNTHLQRQMHPPEKKKNRTHIGASIQARHKCRVYKCACEWIFYYFISFRTV